MWPPFHHCCTSAMLSVTGSHSLSRKAYSATSAMGATRGESALPEGYPRSIFRRCGWGRVGHERPRGGGGDETTDEDDNDENAII